ncbi:MAG: hypothetical protein GEU82_15215 [Luteitalea sp.]|nr:hypothetical protein [Luteitalea sp.]
MARVPAAAVLALVVAAACSEPAIEPLQLERGMLTVNNQTAEPWISVEIWINQAFRVTAATIAARGRFQVPVDSFVAGYGQRFDFGRMQIKDVRLTAVTPDGQPVEHIMAFRQGGLEGAFGGKQ